jgi:flagellar L-ring protein precursor FlgH
MKHLPLLLALLAGFAFGCSTFRVVEHPPTEKMAKSLEAPPTQTVNPPAPGDGSVGVDEIMSNLVADYKAFRVGDVVTVQVNESLAGTTGANSALGNQTSVQGGLTNLFGLEHYLSLHTFLNPSTLVKTAYQSSETGNGTMSATDTFVGNVSAVVTHVTPEGNLIIDGERRVRINGEDDLLVVSGVVRPQDINSSNQVPSSSVANLRLALTGQGQVRDQQGFGWGERVLSWLWPF